MTAVVLGVDLGTTATKVVAATRDGEVLQETERGYPLRSTVRGEAVQDAAVVRDAAIAALADCVRSTDHSGHIVEGVALSGAMHTLVGLGGAGQPMTPVFTWADSRCADVADRLRADPSTADLHRTTGTPIHTQSVMVKLAWLTGNRGDLARDVVHWCALKDFVHAAFTGHRVTDHSIASASGLLDMASLRWSDAALDVAGIRPDRLPALVPPTASVPLIAAVAGAVGLPEGLPVVAGGGDGPLANLGVGAVVPGVAALSLGTSGALRVARHGPGVDDRQRTFCYALADGLWVTGGAVSNGAVVAQWASEVFGVTVPTLLLEAARIPPGANGLLALPYLFGERAPWWQSHVTSALIGLRNDHGRAEITRALVEGVGQQLALVRDAVLASGADVHTIRAAGGGFRSPLWSDVLAAALDAELELVDAGSGLGAALLGWQALGGFDSLADAAAVITPTSTVRPDRAAAELMAGRRPLVDQLHQTLQAVRLDRLGDNGTNSGSSPGVFS